MIINVESVYLGIKKPFNTWFFIIQIIFQVKNMWFKTFAALCIVFCLVQVSMFHFQDVFMESNFFIAIASPESSQYIGEMYEELQLCF